MTKQKIVYGWHILPGNGKLNFNGKIERRRPLLENGKWYSVKGDIVMCKNGLHISKTLRGAIRNWCYSNVGQFSPNAIICRVALKGDITDNEYNDWERKYVGRSRKIIWRLPIEETINVFSRYNSGSHYHNNTDKIRKKALRIAKRLGIYKKDK